MSRTIRRGKPTRNIHKYIGLGIIREEHDNYTYWTSLGWLDLGYPYWKDDINDQRTYDEYCRDEILDYHRDKKKWRCHGLPRCVRKEDVDKQKREHKRAIHNAVRSGDYDVVLRTLVKDAAWDYY
jgi:hypothetical protein